MCHLFQNKAKLLRNISINFIVDIFPRFLLKCKVLQNIRIHFLIHLCLLNYFEMNSNTSKQTKSLRCLAIKWRFNPEVWPPLVEIWTYNNDKRQFHRDLLCWNTSNKATFWRVSRRKTVKQLLKFSCQVIRSERTKTNESLFCVGLTSCATFSMKSRNLPIPGVPPKFRESHSRKKARESRDFSIPGFPGSNPS